MFSNGLTVSEAASLHVPDECKAAALHYQSFQRRFCYASDNFCPLCSLRSLRLKTFPLLRILRALRAVRLWFPSAAGFVNILCPVSNNSRLSSSVFSGVVIA
jgi:hypothetical protein